MERRPNNRTLKTRPHEASERGLTRPQGVLQIPWKEKLRVGKLGQRRIKDLFIPLLRLSNGRTPSFASYDTRSRNHPASNHLLLFFPISIL
jgi:hypothetical protein